MILLRSFLSGHIRIKRTREYYDAGIGPNVPFGAMGFSPVVSQNFLTNTTVPSWLDVSATTGNRMLYDSTGKLTYAPNNLLTYSEDFSNASWSVAASGGGTTGVKTPNYSGATAPDGTNTACRVQLDVSGGAAGAQSQMYKSFTFVGTVVVSAWVKTTDNSTKTIKGFSVSALQTPVNLTVTGTWTRLSAIVPSSGANNIQIILVKGETSDTADLLVWHPQVEAVTYQTTPSAYIATTSAAYYGPRFDYDPSTLAAKGLLIEESRANRCLYSQDFSNAAWLTFGGASKVGVAPVVSPDGTSNAYELSLGTTGGTFSGASAVYQNSIPVVNASVYVFSVWARAKTGTTSFRIGGFAGSVLNIDSGDLSVTTTWQRFSVSITADGTGNANASIRTNVAGNSSNIYIFGAQWELGSFATSYIPTTTASVTRAADIIKLSGTALTTLQGAAGTLLEEATILGNKAAAQYGVYGNTVSPLYWDSLVVKATNGTNVLSSAQTAVVGTAGRGGLAWNASGRAISFSASAAVTDANSFGTIGATVYLGSNNGASALNGWVRALSFYNQRLSNATLATKTTVGGPL